MFEFINQKTHILTYLLIDKKPPSIEIQEGYLL
jgi:hypothetical protein